MLPSMKMKAISASSTRGLPSLPLLPLTVKLILLNACRRSWRAFCLQFQIWLCPPNRFISNIRLNAGVRVHRDHLRPDVLGQVLGAAAQDPQVRARQEALPRDQLPARQPLHPGRRDGHPRQGHQEGAQDCAAHGHSGALRGLRRDRRRRGAVLRGDRGVLRAHGQPLQDGGGVRAGRHFRAQALRQHHQPDPAGRARDQALRGLRLLHQRGCLHQAHRGQQGGRAHRRRGDVQARLQGLLLPGDGGATRGGGGGGCGGLHGGGLRGDALGGAGPGGRARAGPADCLIAESFYIHHPQIRLIQAITEGALPLPAKGAPRMSLPAISQFTLSAIIHTKTVQREGAFLKAVVVCTKVRKSLDGEEVIDPAREGDGVGEHLELGGFALLVVALGEEGLEDFEVGDDGNALVELAVLVEHLLHLPHARPQLLRRLVHHLRLQQPQQPLLLLRVAHLALALQVRRAGLLEPVAQDLEEPQLGVVLEEAEVELGEGPLLLLDVGADVAAEAEGLCKQRVHLHAHLPALEDLAAGLERALMRGDQHEVELLVAQHLARAAALFAALLGDAAVDVLPRVGDRPVEVRDLHALVPREVLQLVGRPVGEEALVELRLRVPDHHQLRSSPRRLYLFDHFIY